MASLQTEEAEVIIALNEILGQSCGENSEGFKYESIPHLWNIEMARRSQSQSQAAWYNNALGYWNECEPTVEGMLGGFGVLTERDVRGSTSFLNTLSKLRHFKYDRVVDCGAGIGRVSKYLLLPLFKEVHILEQSPPLIAQAHAFIGLEDSKRTELLCFGMQDFRPDDESYDVVWIQWVIGHLTDYDLVIFLRRCQKSLRPGGVICLKDNTYVENKRKGASVERYFVDLEDSSMTRSTEYFEAIFKIAGVKVILRQQQEEFPEELYPVMMYALC